MIKNRFLITQKRDLFKTTDMPETGQKNWVELSVINDSGLKTKRLSALTFDFTIFGYSYQLTVLVLTSTKNIIY